MFEVVGSDGLMDVAEEMVAMSLTMETQGEEFRKERASLDFEGVLENSISI
ncbi:MAG: hypothetical protein QXM93_07820 [Candidatus Methanomethyliaceae archaeon]